MATATEQRILVTITLTAPLAKILDAEAKLTGSSIAPLIRRIVKWHRGVAVGRHPDSPKVKFPNRVSKAKPVKKGVLVDEEDATYLDSIGGRLGLPRVHVLILVICQYFDIPTVEPTRMG